MRTRYLLALGWVGLHLAGYLFSLGDPQLAVDVRLFHSVGNAFAAHQAIYVLSTDAFFTNYRYHPLFAWLISGVRNVPIEPLIAAWFIMLISGYLYGTWRWCKLCIRLDPSLEKTLPRLLPLAWVASDWLGALAFGNLSLVLVLVSAILTELLLNKRYRWAGLLVAVILCIKIQWAIFPLLILVAFRNWRGLKLTLAWTLLGYVGLNVFYLIVAGFNYGIATVQAYVVYLLTLNHNYPWRGTEAMFNTEQNSTQQTILRYGLPVALTTVLQIVFVALFVWTLIAWWRREAEGGQSPQPGMALTVVWSGYCVLMLFLPQLEEAVLSGFIIAWLLSQRPRRYVVFWFIPILFFEIPTLLSYATGWPVLNYFNWLPVLFLLMVSLLILDLGMVKRWTLLWLNISPKLADANPSTSIYPSQ